MTQKIETLSQQLFDERAAIAMSLQPLRKSIPLNDINILNDGVVDIRGTKIPMSEKAFKNLAKILGVPIEFQGRFGNLFGDEAKKSLIDQMKKAMFRNGLLKVTAIFSKQDRSIIGFAKEDYDFISNSSFFKVASGIISDHNLSIRDFDGNGEGGVTINTFAPAQWDIPGFQDEIFTGGITFSNSFDKGFHVSPYINRLICSNGIIGEAFKEDFSINQFGVHFDTFMRRVDEMGRNNFKPKEFEARVRKAMSTNASIAEMEGMSNLLGHYSGAKGDKLEKWIPLLETKQCFSKHGTNVIHLSSKQKKNAKTGMPVWDLINAVTHFGTHDNGLKIKESNRRILQVEAGSLLAKTFDMENLVVSPY